MKYLAWSMAVLLSWASGGLAQEKAYEMDFQKTEPGKVPDEFLVLDGAFAVKEDQGNRFLELPGAPLETFGTLFGPTEKDGLRVSAKIFGTSKGRRFPVMAVGLNGAVPIRLQITPSKKSLELFKGDDLLTAIPFTWASGTWTELQLQVVKGQGEAWMISGKAWKKGDAEPGSWQISHTLKEEPAAGRASVWGKPFSETPIWFDDLLVTRVK